MLYRYIGFDQEMESKLDAIYNNELWFSSPREFNDPFDCNFPVNHEFTQEEYRQFADNCATLSGKDASPIINTFDVSSIEQRSDHLLGIRELFRAKIQSYGVCCFTKQWIYFIQP